MNKMTTLLAKLLAKDLLIVQIEAAILAYKQVPTDDNFQKVAMCATLIAIKEDADHTEVHALLEKMAADKIPFFTASAN